ncbi:hypothetical protein D9757_007818 [Collybiopsis confluens]|uniref:Uncharacterized protein n=1 Tax=Collybiopsis confluens TaxID=2823264 RepID=A0A8H5MB53_9AGAR|nr:hypothetical protein D9757_007818 [Collybiopsis confluens]
MAHNKRSLSTSAFKSTTSPEPPAQRLRLSEDRDLPALPATCHHLPDYPEPYLSSRKLKNLKSLAFGSAGNPRNHENAWHAPYSELFHELIHPYPSLAPYPQFRLWRLGSEMSRSTFHRRFPPDSAPPPSSTLMADYAPSEPEEESHDRAFGGENVQAEGNTQMVDESHLQGVDSDPFALLAQNFQRSFSDLHVQVPDVYARLPENVPPISDSVTKEEGDYLELDLHDLYPASSSEIVPDEGTQSQLFQSTSTIRDRDNKDDVPDIVVIHQEIEEIPEVGGQLDPLTRFVEEMLRDHRCAVQTVHYCLGLIGELKRNISRTAEAEIWRDPSLTIEQKQAKITRQINTILKAAKLDLAQYCQIFFDTFPFIDEVIVFATAGPYWQYAKVNRSDVKHYLRKERKWRDEDENVQDTYFGKFSSMEEIGTEQSDKALTEMRNLHLHILAHDDCF